jgi:hypothetical protein
LNDRLFSAGSEVRRLVGGRERRDTSGRSRPTSDLHQVVQIGRDRRGLGDDHQIVERGGAAIRRQHDEAAHRRQRRQGEAGDVRQPLGQGGVLPAQVEPDAAIDGVGGAPPAGVGRQRVLGDGLAEDPQPDQAEGDRHVAGVVRDQLALGGGRPGRGHDHGRDQAGDPRGAPTGRHVDSPRRVARPYFLILSSKVTRLVPRRRAASLWLPPVAVSARAITPRSKASTCSRSDGPSALGRQRRRRSRRPPPGPRWPAPRGRCCSRKSASGQDVESWASAASRAIAFSSWRTLPGHGAAHSAAHQRRLEDSVGRPNLSP